MCWWVSTISSRSSIERPCCGERALERVERGAGVRAGVDQRQRIVLDQVAVDPPDEERRRDRERMDSARGPPAPELSRRVVRATGRSRADQREHLVAAPLHVLARAQRLEAEPQQRLGVRRADVEVPVVVVDRDAVERRLARVGVARGDLGDLAVLDRRPRS